MCSYTASFREYAGCRKMYALVYESHSIHLCRTRIRSVHSFPAQKTHRSWPVHYTRASLPLLIHQGHHQIFRIIAHRMLRTYTRKVFVSTLDAERCTLWHMSPTPFTCAVHEACTSSRRRNLTDHGPYITHEQAYVPRSNIKHTIKRVKTFCERSERKHFRQKNLSYFEKSGFFEE